MKQYSHSQTKYSECRYLNIVLTQILDGYLHQMRLLYVSLGSICKETILFTFMKKNFQCIEIVKLSIALKAQYVREWANLFISRFSPSHATPTQVNNGAS